MVELFRFDCNGGHKGKGVDKVTALELPRDSVSDLAEAPFGVISQQLLTLFV